MNKSHNHVKWNDLFSLRQDLTEQQQRELYQIFLQNSDQKMIDWSQIIYLQQEQQTNIILSIVQIILWFVFLTMTIIFLLFMVQKTFDYLFLSWLYVFFLFILFFIYLMIAKTYREYNLSYYHQIQEELQKQNDFYEKMITSSPWRFIQMLQKHHELDKSEISQEEIDNNLENIDETINIKKKRKRKGYKPSNPREGSYYY